MCEMCRRFPCDPRCPNADDPPPVFVCSGCGENILEGDKYLELMGEQWCESCVEENMKYAEMEERPWS